ncbi:MAG: UvrD-helicase domain-containing protein [Verrucomicrobiota bacterium]
MAVDLNDLNPAQREAASTIDGPVLVLAGAGTGKTRVITYRMAHMIQQGIHPSHILAVTFTNKAAKEIKQRYIHLVDMKQNADARELIAGTFHSFCVRVLRQEIHALGYKKNFTIYDSSDQISLIKKIINHIHGATQNLEPATILSTISLAKNKGINIEALTGDNLIQDIALRYQEELRLRNAVDFDDLLVLTVKLMRECPEAHQRLREKHRYLLIDEFQDTNLLQFQMIELLCSDKQDIFVVGDDDQSIYSWRGAESSHILEFSTNFPQAKVVKLEQNYRCTPFILQAANAVIKNNARRHSKTLWAEGNPGETIRLVAMEHDTHEAEWVASDIVAQRREKNLFYEDFAILYRANVLSRVFEQEFRKLKIPYRILGGLSFYERREVKDIISYLQAIRNPDDDINLLRIINTPPRGIGNSTIQKLIDMSREHERTVWDEMQSSFHTFRGNTADALHDFMHLINHYRDAFYMDSAKADVLKELLEEIDYFEDIRRTCKNDQEMVARTENIKDLVSALASFQETYHKGLDEFLDSVTLDQKQEDADDEQSTGVTLMTLHSAKGLEFRHVYIIGLEEGLLPHEKNMISGDIDEERRLMYVGITRAQKRLTLSYCTSRKKYGETQPRHPSSFLQEIPEDLLEQVDALSHTAPVEHTSASDQLAALRARLASQG